MSSYTKFIKKYSDISEKQIQMLVKLYDKLTDIDSQRAKAVKYLVMYDAYIQFATNNPSSKATRRRNAVRHEAYVEFINFRDLVDNYNDAYSSIIKLNDSRDDIKAELFDIFIKEFTMDSIHIEPAEIKFIMDQFGYRYASERDWTHKLATLFPLWSNDDFVHASHRIGPYPVFSSEHQYHFSSSSSSYFNIDKDRNRKMSVGCYLYRSISDWKYVIEPMIIEESKIKPKKITTTIKEKIVELKEVAQFNPNCDKIEEEQEQENIL